MKRSIYVKFSKEPKKPGKKPYVQYRNISSQIWAAFYSMREDTIGSKKNGVVPTHIIPTWEEYHRHIDIAKKFVSDINETVGCFRWIIEYKPFVENWVRHRIDTGEAEEVVLADASVLEMLFSYPPVLEVGEIDGLESTVDTSN